MEQLDLLSAPVVNIPAEVELDPAKYAADRGACSHAHLHPQSAYRYGCRCKGCVKYRATWRARNKQGPLQCNAEGCTNPRRRVQAARYCEEHAQMRNYAFTGYRYNPPLPAETCRLCDESFTPTRNRKLPFCATCNQRNSGVVHSAGVHHVDVETLAAWIKRGTCGLCARPLYFGKGKGGAQGYAIDHDHSCCDVSRPSCGRCIRDLLCGTCNVNLGHLEAIGSRVGMHKVLTYVYGRHAP